ncbi:MAG: cation diffusion facilitator family transporter [Acidimicrobiales bacterium]
MRMHSNDHGHDHGHGASHGTLHGTSGAMGTEVDRARQRRVLWQVLVANAAFMVVEAIGGLAFGSLALLADAGHMLSDVVGLGIALVAQGLATRPASMRHTFGLQRSEVLGAQANGVILVAAAGWVMFEGISRLGDAPRVEGDGLVIVAGIGLLVNVGSAIVLMRAQGNSLNMRGALVHMIADAVGSLGAIVAGVAVLVGDLLWVDPAVSLFIALMVAWSAWGLLRDATHVLLEGAPRGLDPDDVVALIGAVPGVVSVHHLHLWSIASDTPALSAHVVLDADPRLHDAQQTGDAIRTRLEERFGLVHATLELECHWCALPADHAGHG